MTTYAAPINVKNAALMALGAKPLTDEFGTAKEAAILAALYDPLVNEMLTLHAWNWAKKSEKLVQSGTDHNNQYIYPLPAQMLNLRYITYKGHIQHIVDTEDGELLFPFNVDLYAHYTWRVPEARWPADFAAVVVKRLYAGLARSLMNDFREAERAEDIAEDMKRKAMVRDRRQTRGRDVSPNPVMVDAYRGRRRRGSTS